MGSSPRSRGAPHVSRVGRAECGIIPAFAGSTRPRRRACPFGWDHPRVRGEHSVIEGLFLLSGGSSPRSRGARPRSTTGTSRSWDHPRVRGEHDSNVISPLSSAGSSPRSRGAHLNTLAFVSAFQIIYSVVKELSRKTNLPLSKLMGFVITASLTPIFLWRPD